jgi:hypothetical protein
MQREEVNRAIMNSIPISRLLLASQALLALVVLGCTARAPAPTAAPALGPVETGTPPASHLALPVARWQDTAQRFTAALTERGYVVQAGEVRFFRIEDCLALPTCFGNNPSSPYGVYCLPPAPGDTADPAELPCPSDGQLRWRWRLREDEAMVFLGHTPPAARYFSFRSYLFSRHGLLGRRYLFASLGDSLNVEVIATAGTPHGAAGDPFDQETVVISTADRRLEALLRQVLASSGAPEAIVNTDVIPRSLTRMGLERTSDDFGMLLRVALFADAAAGERYLHAPAATVLRVTPATPAPSAPFPVPPARPRGTDTSEAWLRPALDHLVAAVQARYPGFAVRRWRTRTLHLAGLTCLERRTPCFGDNPDTVYSASRPTWLSAAPRDVLIVAGVHHEATGKASYMNLAVYNAPRLMGVAAVTGSELLHSADRYLPDHPHRRYLYAYTFARDCQGEPSCVAVPTGPQGVALETALTFIERPYLEPVTHTGPLASQIVPPEVLHLCPAFTLFGRCDP